MTRPRVDQLAEQAGKVVDASKGVTDAATAAAETAVRRPPADLPAQSSAGTGSAHG